MITKVYNKLYRHYGRQGWWPLIKEDKVVHDPSFTTKRLTEAERFEICIGAILTQNTSWSNVEKALLELKRNGMLSKDGIRNTDEKRLAMVIKSSGYHNQKARKLKMLAGFLDSKKMVSRVSLLQLWGIGKETADSILLYAYNKPVFVVDAYTRRVFQRLGFNEDGYDELQKLFMDNLKSDTKIFKEYHALLVRLGKELCRKEPLCNDCPLRRICRFSP